MNAEPTNPESSKAGPTLVDESSAQQRRFAQAFQLIRQGIDERVFPGAALAVVHRGRLLAWEGFGRFTYEADSPEVCRETIWDLASLTKPVATASMAMLCYERGLLELDAPVVQYLPEFAELVSRDAPLPPQHVNNRRTGDPGLPPQHAHNRRTGDPGLNAGAIIDDQLQREWRRSITVAMLLAHSSGLPAHRRLYLEAQGREAIQALARHLPLEAAPGTRAEYSDMGFIVLGELLERVAGERLDQFCRRELFIPLKINMSFMPQTIVRKAIPPTVNDLVYRHRIVQGEVNDENAEAMGGVAGHAGLFGDALSVARFGECLLCGGAPLFRPETVALFIARRSVPAGTSRTLGWDTPSTPSQSGTLFSPRSFGHLGYTGTSLWCDPERQLSVTLLTNRTWPDSRNQAIKVLRPKVHDEIVGTLGE